MSTMIRIIETTHHHLAETDYAQVFCLPSSQRLRIDDIVEQLETAWTESRLTGVKKIFADEAGPAIYLADGAMPTLFARIVTHINQVLGMDFVFEPGQGLGGSFYYVRGYGTTTSLADLEDRPDFVLPYMGD